MVNKIPPVVVIANDSVPGSSLPTAAPGLRAFGIAEGLRSHGLDVEILVDRGPQKRIWKDDIPVPTQPGTVSLPPSKFMTFLVSRAPVTVIITNSNQVDHLQPSTGVKYVLDFFAPKMLELAYQHGDQYPTEGLTKLRERKLRAIELADAFIVNGKKKVPYFLAWLLQTQRDIRRVPLEVVNMPMPNHFRDTEAHDKIRFGMAGYLQGWSKPAAWLETVLQYVDRGEATLDVLIPEHWGQANADLESDQLRTLLQTEGVTQHGIMTFSEYQAFVSQMDVILDVFDHTREREYAMVTRTVSAIACGRPVVHPGFTEVSPLISQHDAGWLVDPREPDGIKNTFDAIVANRSEIDEKAQNARRMWNQTFNPTQATRPLVRLLTSLWQ
ncbi:MAG: hypothetical protein ABFR53_11890 [Actinomycetota bacterium]